MVRILLAFLLLCAMPASLAQAPAASSGAAATPAVAGKADLVEGDVRFFDASQRMRRPKVGEAIHEGESIATGADGEVHLRMEDGGYIAVRPGTRMRIVNFRAEGGAEDRSTIGLLEGSFRSVTGWIAKLGPQRAIVRTPSATIGIRGTEHEPLVIPEGSKLGDPGTYDRVHIGETEIRTQQGTVSVRPNQAGFAPVRGALRPRVLDRVPEFFRPTRNEARFTGLHTRIHAQLDQRRDERRKFIEEGRKGKAERGNQGKTQNAVKGEERRKESEQRRAEKKQHAGGDKGKGEARKQEQEAHKAEKHGEKAKADEHKAEKHNKKGDK